MPTTPPPSASAVLQRAREFLRSFGYVTANAETNHALVRDLLALVEDGPHRQALEKLDDTFGGMVDRVQIRQALRDADAQTGRKP